MGLGDFALNTGINALAPGLGGVVAGLPIGLPGDPNSGGGTATSSPSAVRDTLSRAAMGDFFAPTGAGARNSPTIYFGQPASGTGINAPQSSHDPLTVVKWSLLGVIGVLVLWLFMK